jgi:hypothetical protein
MVASMMQRPKRMRLPKMNSTNDAPTVACATASVAIASIASILEFTWSKFSWLTLTLLTLTLVIGAGTASAAAHSGEPSEIATRSVATMAPPAIVTWQMATPVSGVLVASGAGPLPDHELHFQERVSGNIYTVRTKANGAFSTMLPPGVYNLRGKHGAVIAREIIVGQSPLNLGQVNPPPPYYVWRLFERQEMGPAIVNSPAPATAYVPSPGETSQPIAVKPISNPQVLGAGPNGQPLAPAVVMPAQIQEQTELPSGAQVPAPGMPPAQDLTPGQNMAPAQNMAPEPNMMPGPNMAPGPSMAPAPAPGGY